MYKEQYKIIDRRSSRCLRKPTMQRVCINNNRNKIHE